MAMSMGGGGASAPQMNVTPLIDVLLVLIIIFMVIVVSERKEGFKAEIPQPPANPNRRLRRKNSRDSAAGASGEARFRSTSRM